MEVVKVMALEKEMLNIDRVRIICGKKKYLRSGVRSTGKSTRVEPEALYSHPGMASICSWTSLVISVSLRYFSFDLHFHNN